MAMLSHRESVSSSKPTQTVTDSRMAYSQQQSISSTSHSPSVIATSGTKATSNATGATRTTGKTGPTIMFPVLNMAEQDITVKETSGTNQTIDILTKEKGLVAMTLSFDRSPLKYVAVAKTGNESLMISGHREYTLDLKKLGKNGSFPGLYVHKDGQDWKALINGQDSNKKTFHFAATDISGEEVVTLEEAAITKLRFDVIKGSIIQSGISSFGISAPFQLSATSKSTEGALLINGQQIFYANGSKDSSDIVNLVIHKKDQDWRRELSNGNLALTDSMISQFIIMNMLHKDITVEEASSNQFIDIQQSEMMQLARPLSNKKDGFKFSALVKDTNKSVMINDQTIFSIDMHDLSMMNILVVHDEGQNWQQIQSSFLQTGSGSAESTSDAKTSEDEGSPSLQKSLEPAVSKYSLQITAVNMQQNETVVLQEVTDDKENVDIPGNATATLGLLISGATRPLRFRAIVKSSKEVLYINGKKELLVDPKVAKGLESIIVIAKKGATWEQTRSATLDLVGKENQGLVQVDETATYDFASEAKALQLKVVNKAASSIRIQEISSAGQRLDVPPDATATLGFLIRARQEPLKFKAFEATTGAELLLNGQRILPIDVDSNGYAAIIVVHKQGFNFETARLEEYQRTTSSGKGASKTNMPLEPGLGTSSVAANRQSLHFSEGVPEGATNAETANNIILNKISNFSEKNLLESSQSVASGAGQNLPSVGREVEASKITLLGKKPQLGVPIYESAAQNKELMPEKIDFVIVNGANGFAFLNEITGSGQKIELPRKDSIANLSIKTKSRFTPLTFKATMKDSSQQLFVNGKEELDVASEALSPYWLVIHSKGENWEAIKERLQKSHGLKVDLSTPGVTKLIGNSVPTQLRVIPIAFRNIVGKDAELVEVTGTLYKTTAKTDSAGIFALPVTPIGRTEPVKLRAIMRNTSETLLMNGEEEFSIDVNSAYVVIIIHKSEQRWKSARKNFHYATLGDYADIAGNGMGNFDSSELESLRSGNTEKNITVNETDAVVGSGQLPMDTSRIAIWNFAGIEVELRLNNNQLKNFPVGASGIISLTVTKGVTSTLTAVDVNNGAQVFLNNEKQIVVSSENYPQSIIITAQNNSGNTNITIDDKVDPSIKYGKVNFINLANKEVKIFEVSGIGEPTFLSPNFISTFFLKSPKESAKFKALDPITNEVYLLNEQPALEIKLDTNPRIETEVQVTAPKDLTQASNSKDVTCLAVTELGPCYSALQYETQVEAAEGKSETCKKYLEEVLSKCAQKNISHGIDSCKKHCNSKDSDVCERIWSPKVCSSSIVRYSFNPETRACQVMNFNGCLGNTNNFATPEECAKSCIPETESKKPKRHSLEKRMHKIILRNRLTRQLRKADWSNDRYLSKILLN